MDPKVKKIEAVKHEREVTDESLKVERDKTDNLLEQSRSSLELKIDQSVLSNRKVADKALQDQRNQSDSFLRRQQSAQSTPANQEGEATLNRERAQADEVQQKERDQADHFRAKERRQKKLIAESLLQAERSIMDLDLSNERKTSDLEVETQASQLSSEKASHGLTKGDLLNRDRFLAIVSHDLKNPLAAISMSAELIRTSLTEENSSPSEIIELAKMIERNSATMERLIADLLDVERISRGKLSISPSSHSLKVLFQECRDLFLPIGKAKSISIHFENNLDGLSLSFDYDRILQVMSNLIGNALKFTSKGGVIYISASKVKNEVVISVKDNGPGIDSQDQSKIFERFSQLHSNDLRGLGLGLYISKWIIEAHEGRIWVSSKLGHGSQFFFQLPS